MMLKVLIVDDEPWIAQLISSLIHWEELGLCKAGICFDGEEACKKIEEIHPDIVISDIRMPLLDGLGLIERVQGTGFAPNFLLISGYADFSYAQTAIKYGVSDYLLKPVNEDQLNETLSQITKKRQESNEKEAHHKQLASKAQAGQKLMEKEYFTALLEKEVITSQEASDEYFIEFSSELLTAFCLKIDYLNVQSVQPEKDMAILHNVSKMVHRSLENMGTVYAFLDERSLLMRGLVNYDTEERKDIETVFRSLLIDLKNYVYSFRQFQITISISPPHNKEEAAEAVNEAEHEIRERIISGTGRVLISTEKELGERLDVLQTLDRYRHSLQNALQGFQMNQTWSILEKLFSHTLRDGRYNAESYYSLAYEVISQCVHAFGKETPAAQDKVWMQIDYCTGIDQMLEVLKNFAAQQITSARKTKEAQAELPVRKAVEYVQSHYMDKVTLEEVAGQVGLNASYFSDLFKREQGQSFVKYLTQIRMEHAKRLLRTSDDTMLSIAEMVGYADARYFSQSFEKTVGMKPSLYRKLYS